MKHAKFFSVLVLSMVALYGAIGFYALPLANFQGDLTRMGMLPERMFGWTKPQPAIDPALMHQSTWKDADVLVIGDSFSDGRVWQTLLTGAGLRVRTETWDSVRGICKNFMPWLHNQGFKGKFIVLEVIERGAVDVLSKSVACNRMDFHPSVYADSLRSPPPVSFDPAEGDYSGSLSVGIETLMNAFEYDRVIRTSGFVSRELPNDVRLARVSNGCQLFSHARCQDALFLAQDRKEDIPLKTLDSVQKINARLSGVIPIWLFVPNKSTAYLYPDKLFWNEAEHRFRSPNLLRLTQQAIRENTIDLYPANNTHFSTTGYLLMGKVVLKAIHQTRTENMPH
ncbi:MAG: hypothetical protein WCB93_05395 [Gallionella sp.]